MLKHTSFGLPASGPTSARWYRTAKRQCTSGNTQPIPPFGCIVPTGSGPAKVHYSFDYAQQVHYPHNPLQPGPMYFKTARKCGVFGVCSEGTPRQLNYLIDEAMDTGKGANTVVSLLHHFFAHHGLGEVDVELHADNCVGQNKNNTVLQVSVSQYNNVDCF